MLLRTEIERLGPRLRTLLSLLVPEISASFAFFKKAKFRVMSEKGFIPAFSKHLERYHVPSEKSRSKAREWDVESPWAVRSAH